MTSMTSRSVEAIYKKDIEIFDIINIKNNVEDTHAAVASIYKYIIND